MRQDKGIGRGRWYKVVGLIALCSFVFSLPSISKTWAMERASYPALHIQTESLKDLTEVLKGRNFLFSQGGEYKDRVPIGVMMLVAASENGQIKPEESVFIYDPYVLATYINLYYLWKNKNYDYGGEYWKFFCNHMESIKNYPKPKLLIPWFYISRAIAEIEVNKGSWPEDVYVYFLSITIGPSKEGDSYLFWYYYPRPSDVLWEISDQERKEIALGYAAPFLEKNYWNTVESAVAEKNLDDFVNDIIEKLADEESLLKELIGSTVIPNSVWSVYSDMGEINKLLSLLIDEGDYSLCLSDLNNSFSEDRKIEYFFKPTNDIKNTITNIFQGNIRCTDERGNKGDCNALLFSQINNLTQDVIAGYSDYFKDHSCEWWDFSCSCKEKFYYNIGLSLTNPALAAEFSIPFFVDENHAKCWCLKADWWWLPKAIDYYKSVGGDFTWLGR